MQQTRETAHPFHETPDAALAYHLHLRTSSDGSWEVLEEAGRQVHVNREEGRYLPYDLEMRECPCGSTLSRRVPPRAVVEALTAHLGGE